MNRALGTVNMPETDPKVIFKLKCNVSNHKLRIYSFDAMAEKNDHIYSCLPMSKTFGIAHTIALLS